MPNLTNSQANSRLLAWMIAVTLIVVACATNTLARPSSSALRIRQNAATTTPTELKLGQPIERELTGGTVHSYTFHLEANQYLNAVVEQKGIDVVVSIYNPTGEKIYEIDSPNGTEGPEPVYLITQVAGNYRLDVASLEKEAKPGKYEAKITEVRASISADIDRVAGFKALSEAVLLQGESKPESINLAIKKYEEAIEKLEKAGDALNQANVLNSLGDLYKDLANYKMAESLFTQALKIRQQLVRDPNLDIADSLNNLGRIYQDQGAYDMAEPLYIQALDIRRKILGNYHSLTAQSMNNLGLLYHQKGDFIKAEPLYIQALEANKRSFGEMHSATARSLNNLAGLYYNKGDFIKAEPLYIQALDINKKVLGDYNKETSSSLNNLAVLYNDKGDYQKAESLYLQALEIRKKILGETHPLIARSLENLGYLYKNKGDYQKAESLYLQALDIRKKTLGETHPDTAISINDLAELYHIKGDYQKAEPLYLQALDIRKKTLGEAHPDIGDSVNHLAEFYYTKGDYQKAESLYLQALDIRKKILGETHPDTAISINSLACLYYTKGDYQKAEPLYLQALDVRKKILGESNHYTASSLNNLAALYKAKGDISQAINYTQQANNARERELAQNLSLGSERQKQRYLQLYANELDTTIALHVQYAPKDPIARQAALTQILRRKGRSIDAVNQSIEALRKRSKPEDVDLLAQLAQKKTQLSNLTTQGLGKRTPEQYQQQLKAIQDEVEKLEYQISQRSAEFRVQAQPITLQAVQQAVPAEATLVEFASYHTVDTKASKLGTRRYVVYLLNNQGEPQWADLGEAEPIDQLVDELRTKLRSKQTDVDTEVKPLARKLDELVMKPVRNLTGKGKRLLVAPDGKLNLVPFAALVDEQGKFLVENYDISYLTSGRDLLRLQVKIDSKQAPVIIGDPDFGPFPQAKDIKEGSTIFARLGFRRLASTELEAKAIKEIFPTGELLLQDKATELALDNVNAPSILHIATHGFFLEEKDTIVSDINTNRQLDIIGTDNNLPANSVIENPLLRSGLALAGANLHTSDQDNQGIFTALKTTALNLWGTKVVVLSACDTGVGEVKTGDGIYGLRRALVLAGSETQLMSLWPVSDTGTKELMVDYYQRLQQGEGRADALRQVQLELLKHKTHQHPFYWASFIQSGEWANLEGKR